MLKEWDIQPDFQIAHMEHFVQYRAEHDEWLIGAIRRGDPADGHLIGAERERVPRRRRASAQSARGVSAHIDAPMPADASALSLSLGAYQMTVGGISAPNRAESR